MKTIYIVRHAKSSWDEPGLSDHDRPLIAAGIKKTNLVIDYLKAKKVMPGLIITSTARRAKDTALLVADGLGYPYSKIIFDEKIYHASPNSIMDELYALDDQINSVMIFGHNPTLTYFVNQFLEPTIANLPTSGVVAIEFDTDKWVEIAAAKYRNWFSVYPKMLK